MRPRLILFHEPTSSLAPELVAGLLEIFRSLAGEGHTMLVVRHEMKFARRLPRRMHFVRGGVIEESGTPADLFDHPRSERLSGFIGSILA